MKRRLRQELKFLFLLLLIGILWYYGSRFTLDSEQLLASLEGIPFVYRGLIYIILYVIVTFFIFVSKDVFWFAGALLFGAATSTVLICTAEALNACILFFLSHTLGRAYTGRILAGRHEHLDRRLGGVGFLWLFLFRAAPLIPYRFMDLAAGLTKIPFRKYFAAVLIGTPVKVYWIQSVLTGVGKAVLDDSSSVYARASVLVVYFMEHRHIMAWSLCYVFCVVLVVIKIRHTAGKDRDRAGKD